jgi:hypothetical protein
MSENAPFGFAIGFRDVAAEFAGIVEANNAVAEPQEIGNMVLHPFVPGEVDAGMPGVLYACLAPHDSDTDGDDGRHALL